MARFVLQPCKLRDAWFIPTKDVPIELQWMDLCARLAPSQTKNAQMVLRRLERGCFIGLVLNEKVKQAVNFLYLTPDRSGNAKGLVKKDPTFERRLIEVFRVEDFVWDSTLQEIPSTSVSSEAA